MQSNLAHNTTRKDGIDFSHLYNGKFQFLNLSKINQQFILTNLYRKTSSLISRYRGHPKCAGLAAEKWIFVSIFDRQNVPEHTQ